MTPWLSLVGIGDDGLEGLAPSAARLVAQAELLIGGKRHLAMIPEDGRQRIAWPKPLRDLIPEIERRRGQRVCILASGDPLCYGVGTKLLRSIPIAEMIILPAPSAFSLACARLGWSLPDVETLSLHGRSLETLHSFVQPGARLLLLCEDGSTPSQVAGLLRERGYGPSRITVFEHMAGPKERRIEATAEAWDAADLSNLNSVAIACAAAPGVQPIPTTPGLPDDAFRHDGQLTKREVRAATLALLAPVSGQRLWDVGAGCGSIGIEWMRAARNARAIAIERDESRVALITANAHGLGTPGLEVVTGCAPAALETLAVPDAIFIGGGLAGEGLLPACWQALAPGGRLVANAVTLEGEQALAAWRTELGGTLTRIAVSRAAPVGSLTGWRPLMPVTQFAVTKP